MKHKLIILPVSLIFSFFFLITLQTYSQAPAEWATCGACHSIGKGRLVGPDLKGVTERRDEAWLISFIRSSQTMVKEGDTAAINVFEAYGKIPMPDNALSEDDVKALLNYIKTYDPVAEKAAAANVVVKTNPNFLENQNSFFPLSVIDSSPFLLT